MTFHPDSLPDLADRVYIVTGATSGIGLYTAARLAQHNAHVYVCARDTEKGKKAVSDIKAIYPNARLDVLVMNHLILSSVVSAADEFLEKEKKLHGLVNNAGIMSRPFAMTEDGFDIQWQTNYLAHWVLTTRLLPILLSTAADPQLSPGAVRIVNVSSSGHLWAPKEGIRFADTTLKNDTPMMRYGQSKLANILHMQVLHKRYGPGSSSSKSRQGEIWVTAVQPGLVKSSLSANAEIPLWLRVLIAPYRWMGGEMDADRGSWTNVFCVASPTMRREGSGTYYQRIARPNPQLSKLAKDRGLAERLEEWSNEVMKKGGLI